MRPIVCLLGLLSIGASSSGERSARVDVVFSARVQQVNQLTMDTEERDGMQFVVVHALAFGSEHRGSFVKEPEQFARVSLMSFGVVVDIVGEAADIETARHRWEQQPLVDPVAMNGLLTASAR